LFLVSAYFIFLSTYAHQFKKDLYSSSIQTGADNFENTPVTSKKGKKVGIVTNQTGIFK
jgi:uncharacterized protein YbbC (DUF1343 family)